MRCLLQLIVTGLLFSVQAGAATLSQESYVWQRAWGDSLREDIHKHGNAFDGLSILAAEVSWTGPSPTITRVGVDYASLGKSGTRFGLVMRVQSFRGAEHAAILTTLARQLVTEARGNSLSPYELQVDFDCPQSRLEEYARWLAILKEGVAPIPVTFTALPSWLSEPEFVHLARSSPGYVLQVHSLPRPLSPRDAMALCDTNAARAAVERASRLAVPFRVALPTYAYLLGFNDEGRFIGLSADGPRKNWPAGTRFREVWADPHALAVLVRDWKARPPAHLRGFTWYRFPASNDVFNWRWPTLAATMAGRSPQTNFVAELHEVETAFYEVSLVNKGEADIGEPIAVIARWKGARLVASDGLTGWHTAEPAVSSVKFSAPPGFRLSAADRQVIGWLRLNAESEVYLEARQNR